MKELEMVQEEALDLLHECIQHTPLKIEETDGSDYNKGYIFYQDMVVRDVLENEEKLKKIIENTWNAALESVRLYSTEFVKDQILKAMHLEDINEMLDNLSTNLSNTESK